MAMGKDAFTFDFEQTQKKRGKKSALTRKTYGQPDFKDVRKNVIMNVFVPDVVQIDYSKACAEYADAVYGKLKKAGRVESDIVKRYALNAEQQLVFHRSVDNYVREFTVTRCGITRHYVSLVPR